MPNIGQISENGMVFNLTCLTQEHDFTYANVKIGHFKSAIDVVDIFGDKNIGDRPVQAGLENRTDTHHKNTRIDQLINIVHLTAEQTA